MSISSDQLAKVMAGMKTGKKENPKPLAEKVAEAKPVDDAVGKITEKPPVVTETAPPPQPKVEEKPVEKKPDPPKVVENKPKEEPKPVEKKPDPPKAAENSPTEKKPDPVKPDPIAEAIKKEEKKPPPKPVQAAKPPEPAEAEDRRTALRSDADRGAARQARPDAPGHDRRYAEFQCRAWPRQGHGRGQFRNLGLDVPAAGRAMLEEAVWRHRIAEA